MNTHKQNKNRKAVVLFSGGLDSTTCLAIAISNNFETHAITFCYGQRHQSEIKAASEIARSLSTFRHELFNINLAQFGGSSLTGVAEVPKDRSKEEMSEGVPSTYVPARNTVFLSIALARAETIGASDIYIGVNALDYSGYPDCRPEFIEAFQNVANLATKASVENTDAPTRNLKVHEQIKKMTKSEIIKKGINELANLIIITKDDGNNQEKVKETMLDYNSIMSLNIKTDANSIPKVFKCSSHENTGIKEINIATKQYIQRSKETNLFNIKRTTQKTYWINKILKEELGNRKYNELKQTNRIIDIENKIIKEKKNLFDLIANL